MNSSIVLTAICRTLRSVLTILTSEICPKYSPRDQAALAPKRPAPPLEEHPLVKHYGLPVEGLALTKAHRRVEGSHRAAAWRMILDHVPSAEYAGVLAAMERTLEAWRTYRDAVAAACGLTR